MILGIVAGASRPVSVQALIVPHEAASPYVAAYPVSAAGFGVKYADPDQKPTARCIGAAQSADKKTVYLSSEDVASPISAYAWSASGFGAKRANPVETPKPSLAIAISAGGDIGVGHLAANGTFSVWATNADGSIGAKYASPAGMIISNCYGGVGFNADAFFAAVDNSPYIHAWAFTPGVGFGAKFVNPASLPTNASRALSAADGVVIVGNGDVSTGVSSYAWSPAGFGAVSTVGVGGGTFGLAISRAGNALAVAYSSAGTARSYHLSGSTIGAALANLNYGGTMIGQGADFSKDDTLAAVCTHQSPFIHVAAWSNATGFGAKLAAPSSLPGGPAWRPKFVYT